MEYGGVSLYARNSKLAAYQSVSVHGGVANADPHGLVLMLMDAAVERMTTARGCLEHGEIVRKAKLLHSCISIIAELRTRRNSFRQWLTSDTEVSLVRQFFHDLRSAVEPDSFRVALRTYLRNRGQTVICSP